jgi:hypothetical protein
VIGIGAVVWLSLLLAAALGYRFDTGIPRLDTAWSVALIGVAYLLGIVVDRLAYTALNPLENAQRSKIIEGADRPDAEEMERYVVVSSEALGRQIQYNRSRLRICRAWALNALLVSLAFVVWNLRLRAVPLVPSLAVVGVGFVVSGLMGWTAWALMRDHFKNLLGSYEFLKRTDPRTGGG